MAVSPRQTLIGSYGKATSPGAAATIAFYPLNLCQVGATYNVTVSLYVDGTVAAATDDDNWRVFINSIYYGTLMAPSNGSVVTYNFVVNADGSNNNIFTIGSLNAATAGAVYHAQITVTPADLSPTD
jgi:hypothetical protein